MIKALNNYDQNVLHVVIALMIELFRDRYIPLLHFTFEQLQRKLQDLLLFSVSQRYVKQN